jgi:signal transduction histidine kinase
VPGSAWIGDLAVVAVVAFPTAMDAWWNEPGTRQADALTYGLTVVSIVALLFRRRWPLPTAVVCGAALTGWYVLGHHGELLNLPTMVALYAVAVGGDRRTTLVVGLVASSWSGILGFTSDDPVGARGGSPVLEMLWPLVPLALGEATRARRELVTWADREREHEAQRRVEAERARMAREFHDLVAHTMAAVNVQMSVAVAAFDADPETARSALVQARASSKEALAELRATVAVMRQGPEAPARAPTPRLAHLDDVAAIPRAAGLTVTITHSPLPTPRSPTRSSAEGADLPAAVELAAYRIVQEALTNVVRHSNARHVTVSLHQRPTALEVEVVDDGTSVATTEGAVMTPSSGGVNGSDPAMSGFGLLGMAERAAAVGGRFEHGPNPGGGFRVHAILPTAPQQAASPPGQADGPATPAGAAGGGVGA